MDLSIFQPDIVEYVGTAPGHTVGMVIANLDPVVRTLMKIPEKYSSIGIISTRTGASTEVISVDDAVKSTNTELVLFEIARDTEGYGGPGTLTIVGAEDVSDARRAVELSLDGVRERAKNIFVNEVAHLELQTTASAGPVINAIFGAPMNKAFGFSAVGLGGIGLVTWDSAVKEAPIDVVWYGTPQQNMPFHNEVTIGFSGSYAAVQKAASVIYYKWSELAATLGSKPDSMLTFGQSITE